jgi:hypothetical protein
MVGGRSPDEKLAYFASEVAARHNATPTRPTDSPRIAYEGWTPWKKVGPVGWPPPAEPPEG